MAVKTIRPERPAEEAGVLVPLEELRKRHRTGAALFAGVCAANGWKLGRAVTDAEFCRAAAAFRRAPMGKAGCGVC